MFNVAIFRNDIIFRANQANVVNVHIFFFFSENSLFALC